nr:MAG TPA: hypothetical protein [Caudoviricetes sp.]
MRGFLFLPQKSNLISSFRKMQPNIEMSFTFLPPKVKFKIKTSKINAD